MSEPMDAARCAAKELLTFGGTPSIIDHVAAIIRRHFVSKHDEKEALGWLVYCPKGHEFDSLIFPNKEEAEAQADLFNDDLAEGEENHEVIPLFSREAITKKDEEIATLRKEFALCYEMSKRFHCSGGGCCQFDYCAACELQTRLYAAKEGKPPQ